MSITCVSSYYQVKNKHDNKYNEWFKNTLSINLPYIFFTDTHTVEFIKSFRKDLPTYFIECDISEFETYKYKDKFLTDPVHCPSVELSMIWHEKLFMVEKACRLNPFNTDWFHWVDAGVCVYRDKQPPNNLNTRLLEKLPTDKFIFSSSTYHYNPWLVSVVSDYHHIAGTSYILHKSFVSTFTKLYKTYLENLPEKAFMYTTDQIILTHIYKDYPELYFKLCHDYGNVTSMLMI